MDEFVTVFTFIDQANQLLSDFPRSMAIGILPYVIGAAFVVIPAIRIMIVKKVWLLSLGILAFCWVFVGLPLDSQIRNYQSVKQEYRELLDVYNRQAYQVVEGIVHARQILSPDRRSVTDIVSIGAVEFEIRDFVATVAYAATLAEGGVLKEGVYARVYYYEAANTAIGKRILRIDLQQSGANASAAQPAVAGDWAFAALGPAPELPR